MLPAALGAMMAHVRFSELLPSNRLWQRTACRCRWKDCGQDRGFCGGCFLLNNAIFGLWYQR